MKLFKMPSFGASNTSGRNASGRNTSGRNRRRVSCKGTRNKTCFRRLEGLEDRVVLSAMSVVNTNDSGAGSLRQAILDANENPGPDEIQFAAGVQGVIGLTTGQLAITDELTIDGPGAGVLTVSGSGMSRVFHVAGAKVTIGDIMIADGTATDLVPENPDLAPIASGGGLVNLGGDVTLNRVHVTGNSTQNAVGAGAGVGNSFGASLTVNSSTFSDNLAFGLLIGAGGAISADANSTITVNDTSFLGNKAVAATGFNADVTFSGLGTGGAIWGGNGSTANITDSRFENNLAKGGDGIAGTGQDAGWGVGGAVAFSTISLLGDAPATVNITGSTFSGNQSIGGNGADGPDGVRGGNGGPGLSAAIHISTGAEASINSSELTGNQAISGDGGAGGAGADGGESDNYANIYFDSSGTVGLYGGRIVIVDSSITDNLVQGGHGGRGGSGANGGNSHGVYAGAIRVDTWEGVVPASLQLTNTMVSNNLVIAGQGGKAGEGGGHDGSDGDATAGGVWAFSQFGTPGLINVTMTDSTVSGNVVQGNLGANTNGVGILADIGTTLILTNVTISDNKQVVDGVDTVVDSYGCEGILTDDGCAAARQGDANRDGVFNSADLMLAFQAGEYEDEIGGNSNWAEGDWNGDQEFDSGDIVAAFQAGGYSQAATRNPIGPTVFGRANGIDASKPATEFSTGSESPQRGRQVHLEMIARDSLFEDLGRLSGTKRDTHPTFNAASLI